MLPIVGVPETIRQGLTRYRDPRVGARRGLSRRAMHEAVFEAGREGEQLMPSHRAVITPAHLGCSRAVLSLDSQARIHRNAHDENC
ncbi:MAG: hypothetical protein AB7N91_17590 [Candidatus Tectimicrobiota bacterium]